MNADLLATLFAHLKETEPSLDHYDVVWPGPYVILRKGEWCATSFMLFGGKLYCNLWINGRPETITWTIEANRIEYDTQNAASCWEIALPDVAKRLRTALANLSSYNKRIARQLPPRYRTGKIQRRLTWPKKATPPLTGIVLANVLMATEHGQKNNSWPELSLSRYLNTAALCYDVAGLPKIKELSPLEKYKAKADGRHGGMLDLPARDADAFKKWFRSPVWSGSHPWEIIYGVPHGITLSPSCQDEGWRFYLSVDSPYWYKVAAKMVIALNKARVPFEFIRQSEVIAALCGLDDVRIGPGEGLAVEELKRQRPDALKHIKWDSPWEIQEASPQGKARIEHVLKNGSPAHFTWNGVEVTPLARERSPNA